MKYDLTAPCGNCPFRTDITFYLDVERVEEIVDGLVNGHMTFTCHKTAVFDDEGDVVATPKEQHCAGAMILLEKIERPNQMMRIAGRIGLYDRRKLKMDAPVYDTPDDMIRAFEDLNA